MAKAIHPLLRYRPLLGGLSLLALGSYLTAAHQTEDAGIASEDLDAEAMQAMAADVDGPIPTTGRWVLDFVEPEDGEGGSEEAIAQFAAELDGLDGITVEKAGFYSEGEHLFLLSGSASALESVLPLRHPLLEGAEPELIYSLPESAMSALDAPLDAGDEIAPAKPKPPRMEPDDPMFRLQWHMEQIRAPEAWSDNNGEGAVVAVIDTGVAWHDSQGIRGLPDLAGTEFVAGESFVAGPPDGLDDHAHGSHVAGTIAQTTNNGIGVTGVAFGSKIMPLKVLSRDGRGSVPGIANAIRYAADNGAHVINMSLGGPLPSKVLSKAVEYAHDKGVTVVCAAGNERRSRVGYPAAYQHSVAVSATDYSRGLSFYSNWGKHIDVAAPGGDTRADKNGDGHPDGVLQNTIKIQKPLENDYLWFQGTSMAAPHAAGVAALIVSRGVTNPDEVERIMKTSAAHPDGVEWDERYGAGIVDAKAASDAAHGSYAPERAGIAGLLGLMGLGGLGLAAASRRRRALGVAGLATGALLGSGAMGLAPAAYGIAGLGGTAGVLGFGSPLLMSAALPLVAVLLFLGVKPLRGFLAGLALGYAALLLHGAMVLPTLITELPGGAIVDRLWLGVNAVVAFLLARKVSRLPVE